MGRIKQPKGTKGSLKWIQHVINRCPSMLDGPIHRFISKFIIDVEKLDRKLPKGLMVFDPDNPPFQEEYTCVLLSKLKEE